MRYLFAIAAGHLVWLDGADVANGFAKGRKSKSKTHAIVFFIVKDGAQSPLRGSLR